MADLEKKIPLSLALQSKAISPGVYEIEFAPSLCFGSVVTGGLTESVSHKAANDFISTLPKSSHHQHVLYFNFNFFRPTLAAPVKTTITFRPIYASRASTVLQVDVTQKSKLCCAGTITMGNLQVPNSISLDTGWRLSPAPIPTSISSLESDTDPNWVGYLTPFSMKSARRPQSYIQWHLPINLQDSYHIMDQWITPGWKDESKDGAVWTNELVHFVLDNVMPMINDLMRFPDPIEPGLHKRFVKAGLAQRQARLESRHEAIWGDYLGEGFMSQYILSTIAISTEVKRLLPERGARWLFMRVEAKDFVNMRLDHQVVLLNDKMELVAVSHQLVQVIPIEGKQDKSAKL